MNEVEVTIDPGPWKLSFYILSLLEEYPLLGLAALVVVMLVVAALIGWVLSIPKSE